VPARILALRGATTVAADDPAQIDDRTQEMLRLLLERNDLRTEDLVSLLFSVTADIRSKNPATAARAMGLSEVPLLGMQEADIAGALPLCIRVMIHLEADRDRSTLRHVFLHGAKVLRPDLVDPDD
jgi:chorismate mutase